MRSAVPSRVTEPPRIGSTPNTARAIEVRPEPTSPATPRISPRRTDKSTWRSGNAAVTNPLMSQPRPSGVRDGGTYTDFRSRPIISRIIAACEIASRASSPATRPSRRQTTRSALVMISPSRWVM